MWRDLGTALCLLMVLEGIMPFLAPGRWRGLLLQLATLDNRSVRSAGLVAMVVGAGLLYLVRGY